ncbi:MAG: HAD-IIIC family phosphatase, partial [Ginsengibacter sp.]
MHDNDHLKVSLCASFIADPLQNYLIHWSKEFKMDVDIAIAPYNQVFQQLLDSDSLLNKNNGINILFIRVEDWLRDKKNISPSDQIRFLNETYETFIEAIKQSRKFSVVPILIGIIPLSPSHTFTYQTATTLKQLNTNLYSLLKYIPSCYLLNPGKIASLYEVEEMFDSKSDEVGHIPFTQEYYAALGTCLWRKIRSYKRPSYKVIALDCDNTLWKGVCGEDGALKVVIDQNYAYLQEFLLEKYHEGFLLVLCSKNNESDVWEVFNRHPEMKIKQEHITAHRINWDPKPGNLAGLSKELNVGLDSFIFLDDNNFETEQVLVSCPEVLSLCLPENSTAFFSFLNHIWEFDVLQVTQEDLQRNKMYKAEKQRKEDQINYALLDEFFMSLNIIVTLYPLQEKDLDRAVQLTLRTNQFNLNGIRKTYEEIKKTIHQKNSISKIIHVQDRFGDYGNVGLLLAKKINSEMTINTFVLSCRVLGRNVEELVFSQFQKYCLDKGVSAIIAQYHPTLKNQPFIDFL